MPSPTCPYFPVPRLWIISLILGFSVSLAGSPALAQGPPADDPLLALLGDKGLYLWEPGAGAPPTLIPATETTEALVMDRERSVLWILGHGGLSARDADGAELFSVELDLPEPEADPDATHRQRHLALRPSDGSLWVAAGSELWSVGHGGEILEHVVRERPVVDLALDAELLWVASEHGVTALDVVSGDEIRSLPLPEDLADPQGDWTITALATVRPPETETGEEAALWIGAGARLLHFGAAAEGEHELRLDVELVPERVVTRILDDRSEGAWVLAGEELGRYREQSGQLRWQTPIRPPVPLAAAAFDGGSGSVWVAGGESLVQVGTSGWALGRRHRVGFAALDLDVVRGPLDDTPPELSIYDPDKGEVVHESRPALRFTYSDDLSGIREGSLRIEIDGQPIGAGCSYFEDRAACRPSKALPEKEVVLTATIDDAVGNRSQPVRRTFTVALGSGVSTVDADQPNVYTPVITPRGVEPNKPFHFGDVDSVDLASGNVTIRIPLGQVYEVGPMVSYQFQAVHSNPWDTVGVCPKDGCKNDETPQNFSLLDPGNNAGAGWTVSLGHLYSPERPAGLDFVNFGRWPNKNQDVEDAQERWLYVAPDGARYTLHTLEGRDNGTSTRPVRYSKDGTFLRMRQTSDTRARVEFPDGRYAVFEKTGEFAGTNFCGGGISGCWRFREMRDPYGNGYEATYAHDDTTQTETWTITDSTGRSHTIDFGTSNAQTEGGDAGSQAIDYTTQDGDEWGDLRRVVLSVNLAAFGGETATYDFEYQSRHVQRACLHDGSLEGTDKALNTRVLLKIKVPHSEPYVFVTADKSCIGARITELTLPTGGGWKYAFTNWQVPTRCNYSQQADSSAAFTYDVRGITSKTRVLADGTEAGKWTYDSDLVPAIGLVSAGADCTRAKYRKTEVDAPANVDGKHVRTVHYNSVYEGPADPSGAEPASDWQVTDHGMPYSKHDGFGSGLKRKYLSSQTYLCDGETCGTAKRSTYRRYVSEFRICKKYNGQGDGAGCFQVNPLQLAERVLYHDDGSRYREVRGSEYDGAGHFEIVETVDNFADATGTTIRKVETLYTATDASDGTNRRFGPDSTTGYIEPGTPSNYLPGPGEAWILTPTMKTTTSEDGRSYVVESEWNDKGSVTCRRTWKNGTERSGQDRVVKLTLGTTVGADAGLPTTEVVSGGDFGELDAESLCAVDSTTTDGRKYTFTHTFSDLQLASTRIGSFPYRYRADVDESTGLPEHLYDPADQMTTLDFDLLGRLTKRTPASSMSEATTVYVYRNQAGVPAEMEVRQQSPGGNRLTTETTVFDGFGRPVSEHLNAPVGDGSTLETAVQIAYDAAGHEVTRTTRQRIDGSNTVDTDKSWRSSGFDAFGRPGTITAPDGQVETRSYQGDRVTTSTVAVRTTTTGTQNKSTTTTKDAQGRTVSVATSEHTTTFTYDPFGRQLTSSRQVTTDVTQTRTFGRDARGQVVSVDLPEVSGTITYARDALGLARTVFDGLHTLDWTYDGNGRPTEVADDLRTWKTWTYAANNSGNDQRKGRVTEAVRYNYPPAGEPVAVAEGYRYFGGTHGPSEIYRDVIWPNRPESQRHGGTFRTTLDYDFLGNLQSLDYPRCVTSPDGTKPCADGNDALGPAHTVTWDYNQGAMRRVSSNRGPSVVYEYYANLQRKKATYSNGVIGTYDQGTDGMSRPTRRKFTYGILTYFDTGAYEYL